MSQIRAYKIRDKKTGLFSKGGQEAVYECGWSKTGKVWNSEGSLKSHLTMLTTLYSRPFEIPESWEVVVLTYDLSSKASYSAKELADRPAKK